MKLLKLALIAALSCLMGCASTPEPAQPSQGLSLATSATASAAADVDAGIRDIAAMRLDKSLGAGADAHAADAQGSLADAKLKIAADDAALVKVKAESDAKDKLVAAADAAKKKAQEDSTSHAIHELETMGVLGAFILAAGIAATMEFKENGWIQAGEVFGIALIVLGFGLAIAYRGATLAIPWVIAIVVASFAIVAGFVVYGILTRKFGFKQLADDAVGFKQPTVPFPPSVQKMLTVLAPHTIAATPVPPEVATAAAPGT